MRMMITRLKTRIRTILAGRFCPRSIGMALIALVFVFNFSPAMIAVRKLPEAFFVESGDEVRFPLQGGTVSAAYSGDETLGSERVSVRLFGSVELANVPVFTVERAELIPGGTAAGISIRTEGVLIVGFGDVKAGSCPAAKAGLRAGDLIISVNGEKVYTAEELQLAVSAAKELAIIGYERGGKLKTASIAPDSGRIGAWVRDSTVGIGTLSFITASGHSAALLGHAIVDADTGRLLPVHSGETCIASIVGVSKGETGLPGELKGTFSEDSERIGKVLENCELGVFGTCDNADLTGEAKPLSCAFPSEVHTGDAFIIAQADGEGPQQYSCRIVRAARQSRPDQKGLVIEVTDERLIEKTGGIVQGMSGSPIIQDGRLAGVVTHVFVNDPLRGYGIYAYWMLDKCGGR